MASCCTWLEFITSVRRMWRTEWGQFSHTRARTAWGKYAATAGEFIARERIDLEDERASLAPAPESRHGVRVGEVSAQPAASLSERITSRRRGDEPEGAGHG